MVGHAPSVSEVTMQRPCHSGEAALAGVVGRGGTGPRHGGADLPLGIAAHASSHGGWTRPQFDYGWP
jgi:hypothetical protein